jgi:predicted DNA-binding protein YlxM (UPF0122 family)
MKGFGQLEVAKGQKMSKSQTSSQKPLKQAGLGHAEGPPRFLRDGTGQESGNESSRQMGTMGTANSRGSLNKDLSMSKFKHLIINDANLSELQEAGVDSFAQVGELILQMLKCLKRYEDPYDLIRTYTDLVQHKIYESLTDMFNDSKVQSEMNNSLKLERWGIIFLFYFALNGKLSEKINSNMLNLLTHVCQNFHIQALLIDKNAKMVKRGPVISRLRSILDKLDNPYMDINSEV